MPFGRERLRGLREAKGLSQPELAKEAGLSQSAIAKCEKGSIPGAAVLEKLAEALDCTTDYLLGRGREYGNPAVAAAHMAFDVFSVQQDVTDEQRGRCGRVLQHRDAPKTAQGWRSFAEMFELALKQRSSTGPLDVVQRDPKKPMAVSRRPHS